MSMLSTDEQQVLYLIQSEQDYAAYFFARAKSLKWFCPLKEQGYFNAGNIRFDENGHALFWIVLNYLERVSEQVARDPVKNAEYGRKLLGTLGGAVQFSQDVKRLDSYHIWWYCVKILNNIPSTVVRETLPIENQEVNGRTRYGFKTWLATWTDPSLGDLALADIGGKLLPKFLADDTAIAYAEAIISTITRIKASGKISPLMKRDDAVLLWEPHWIIEAFRNHRELIGAKSSIDTIFDIADKLRRALEYKRQDSSVNPRLSGNVYELSVSRVPADGLLPNEIGFKEGAYLCVLQQYSSEQTAGLDLTESLLPLYNIEPEIELKRFSIEATGKPEFVTAVRGQLPKDIEWGMADDLGKALDRLFDGLYDDYSHIWCQSLEHGPEYGKGAEEVLTTILRDMVLSRCQVNRKEGASILEQFLEERYRFAIFRRLVLLCVNKHWTDYTTLFERFLELTPNVLEEPGYEVELQDILKDHHQELSPTLVKELKKWIEAVPSYYAEREGGAAHWNYKWLSPLRERPEFIEAYQEAKSKVKPKDDKPYEPSRSTFTAGFVGHKSPLSKEAILQKPIIELVKELNGFQGADFWRGLVEGEPDKEGLGDALCAAVKEDPKKFTDDIEAFHQTNYFYAYNLLRGLKEAWADNKELDWGNIFDFCLKYLGRDKDALLKEAIEAQGEYSKDGKYIWIIDIIVDLIDAGCKDDARAFDPKYFQKANQTFDALFPLLKGEKHPDIQGSALGYVFNTTLGKTIEAFVSFSLRVARATKKKEEGWGRNKFECFFVVGIDAYIWCGFYLPQFNYLDPVYVAEKVHELAERPTDDIEWQRFMEGYLFAPNVYKNTYGLMRPHYIKALEYRAFEERIDDRLVEHVTFGYLYYGESLRKENVDGSSLFWKCLEEAGALGRPGRWREVVDFFWSCTKRTLKEEDQEQKQKASEATSEVVKQKILEFWAWMYEQQEFVKARIGDQYDTFLGRIALLTILLDKIDETTEPWLMLCAPHIEREYNAAFFIEYLTKFKDEDSLKRVSRIFLKMLEHATPTYKQEDIQLIVERLYQVGATQYANDICTTYGRRGYHFLRLIWKKYQHTAGNSASPA